MILLAGIRSESPLRKVAHHLEGMDMPTVLFHQRDFENAEIAYAVDGGRVTGRLVLNGDSYPLENISGAYMRLMDYRQLPEVLQEPADSPKRTRCAAVHDTLVHWAEIAPARVVNRMAPMGSNFSKPYQAQLILRAGFKTPETLVTNVPEAVRAFRKRYGRVIYKSISGVRSIVKELTDEDEARLDHVRWCPTQFQQYVHGTDVRVHTIGRNVFATEIKTTGTDYRYAQRDADGHTDLTALELPDELRARCLQLADSLGLSFAGIDLKITPENDVYCFEVNPCPAYSYYESHTEQPIAEAVARYLAGMEKAQ